MNQAEEAKLLEQIEEWNDAGLNGCHNLVIRGILCCLLCLTARNYLLIVVTLVMLGEIALCIGNKL